LYVRRGAFAALRLERVELLLELPSSEDLRV